MGRCPDRSYPRPRVRPWAVGRWEMWQLRGPVVAVVLLVCGTAALLVGVEIGSLRPTAREILDDRRAHGARAGAHRDREQGRADAPARLDKSYYDLSSVWTFAAALLLPHRSPRPSSSRCNCTCGCGCGGPRRASSTATSTRPPRSFSRPRPRTPSSAPRAGFHAGAPERSGWPCCPGRRGLRPGQQHSRDHRDRAAGHAGRRRGRVRHLLGKVDDIALEMATLSLGALTAVSVTLNPWLVLLVLVPLVVLHRADMARQLKQRAAMDGKTGLLNAAAWQDKGEGRSPRAAREPRPVSSSWTWRTSSPSNDTYGHLAATRSWPRSPRRCAPRCGRATSSAGSAARSSWCCCATST